MDTLYDTINRLRTEGYTVDMKLVWDRLKCEDNGLELLHDEFIIDKFYRFEGESDPDDEATVYAISSLKHKIKGILVNGGGIYTDAVTDKMLAALQIQKQ
jgi:hypothetical protein